MGNNSLSSQFGGKSVISTIGTVTGTYASDQFPSVKCFMARLKAHSANAGSFFVGTADNEVHFELDAGDDTGWFAIRNLNQLFHGLSSGTSDVLSYWTAKDL